MKPSKRTWKADWIARSISCGRCGRVKRLNFVGEPADVVFFLEINAQRREIDAEPRTQVIDGGYRAI